MQSFGLVVTRPLLRNDRCHGGRRSCAFRNSAMLGTTVCTCTASVTEAFWTFPISLCEGGFGPCGLPGLLSLSLCNDRCPRTLSVRSCRPCRRQRWYGWFCWLRCTSRCVGISRCILFVCRQAQDLRHRGRYGLEALHQPVEIPQVQFLDKFDVAVVDVAVFMQRQVVSRQITKPETENKTVLNCFDSGFLCYENSHKHKISSKKHKTFHPVHPLLGPALSMYHTRRTLHSTRHTTYDIPRWIKLII